MILSAIPAWAIPEDTEAVKGSVATSARTTLSKIAAQRLLFSDDFEGAGLDLWELESGWTVTQDSSGRYMNGQGHYWAHIPLGSDWADYTLAAKVRINQGGVHLNARMTGATRYFVSFAANHTELWKQTDEAVTELADDPTPNDPGVWHQIEFSAQGTTLSVTVDGAKRIEVSDAGLRYGTIAFETLDSSSVDINDVYVNGSEAPGPTWTKLGGPIGGIGYDVRIDKNAPGIVYVTDAWSGAHRSKNGGTTWEAINQGIVSRAGPSGDSIPIFSLTIDPRNRNIMWAGTEGMRGIYKSTDGGTTWRKMDNGIPLFPYVAFRSFTIDPTNSDIVYAGAEVVLKSSIFSKANPSVGRLFKTVDGGQTWTQVLASRALVRPVIIDPKNPRMLYVATGIFDRWNQADEGIFKSTNGGASWRKLNTGIWPYGAVGGLAMDPKNSQVLYVSTGKASQFGSAADRYGSIYKTINGGASWKRVYGPLDMVITYLAVSPSHPNVVYADTGSGVFLASRDAGRTWSASPNGPAGIWAGFPISVAVHPTNPNVIFINAYGGGVFKSLNGGKSWFNASKGYTGAQVASLAVSPLNGRLLVAGARMGVFRSADAGASWSGLVPAQPVPVAKGAAHSPVEIYAVAMHPRNPNLLLVGHSLNAILFRSLDGGKTWKSVVFAHPKERNPENIQAFHAVVFAPSNPNVVYAGEGLSNPTVDYDRNQRARGVYKSLNGGQSWFQINTGIAGNLSVHSLAVDPLNANLVYAGTLNNGLYRTTTGGARWVKLAGLTATEIRSIAIDRKNPKVVYAAAAGSGVWKSLDRGATWKLVSQGMGQPDLRSVVVDPTNSSRVYTADQASGVYVSTNAGASWSRINRELTNKAVNALALSADGKLLYAATEGQGVFRLSTLEVTRYAQLKLLQALPKDSRVPKVVNYPGY